MKTEHSIEIPAPREFVWRLAHDATERPIWDVRVASLEMAETAETPAAGAAFTIGWRTPVMRSASACEYLAFEEPSRSVARIGEATLPIVPPGIVTWLFEVRNGGTRVTMRFESDAGAPHVAPDLLVRMLIRRDTGRSLKNLRQLVAETVEDTATATQGLAAAG